MARKLRFSSVAANLSATLAQAAAPTGRNGTARAKYMRELSVNPQFREAIKSGQTFGIVGARPVKLAP
jgi:hypothetical protein